jgi:predicted Zn-dependent protease
MKRFLAAFALLALGCPPALAQFDLGKMLDYGKKAIDTGKKLQEANKEYTTEEEVALGEGITSGFLGAAPLHADANLQRYVNRVGKWLALHSERADLPWSFGVIDTDTVNAFAMPGGTVLVSHGLVKKLANESELAGVLAHEIAHVVKKHQLSAIQSGAGSEALSAVGKEMAGQAINRRGGDVMGLKTQLAGAGVELVKNGVFLRPLDRSMEYEADRLGVVIATRAGYDPYGLVAVLQMLTQLTDDGGGASIFSTHPAAGDRIGELEKFVPAQLERFASQPQVEGRFRQVVGGR